MRTSGRLMMFLVAFSGACGGPARPPGSVDEKTGASEVDVGESVAAGEGNEGGGHDAGTETITAEEGGCPATMKEATGYCVKEGAKYVPTICHYPEGSCRCGPPEHCGGMAPEPVPMQEYTWQCSTPPPDVLPDGCPGQVPPGGATCDDEGKVCWIGKCCVQKLECVNGQWQVGAPLCPP